MSFQEFHVPPPPPVMHEDWLASGLDAKIRGLELLRDGAWPTTLRGRSIVVTCLWLLRCVYGSDEASVEALRVHVHGSARLMSEVVAHAARWPRGGCPDPLCYVCLATETLPKEGE